jgi:energy-coupling factor transporter transmembrane protein EcfT
MYQHTQRGWVVIIALAVTMILFISIFLQSGVPAVRLILSIVSILLIITFALFNSLKVEVDEKEVRTIFGIGLVKKKIPLSGITSCQKVRNKWYYGFGIRYVPQSGWMYNISGLDAVELTFTDGKKFRIGTDEPDKLLSAISLKIGKL